MINTELPEQTESTADDRVERIVAAGPGGALTVAGIATALVVGDVVRVLPLRLSPSRSPAMTVEDGHHGAEVAARTERRWATISVIIIVVLAVLAAFAGIHQVTMPQPRVETIDPTRLHLCGRVRRVQSRQRAGARRLGDRARHRPAIFLHAGLHPGAGRHADHASAPPAPTWFTGFLSRAPTSTPCWCRATSPSSSCASRSPATT